MTEAVQPVPLGMPKRFSHSQLTSYMVCGEQYRLERRHKMGGSISWALLGGSAFHTWTEVWDEGVDVDPAYFVELLAAQVAKELASDRNPAKVEADIKPTGRASKEWPNKRDRAWWEHHGPIFCQKYIDWRHAPDNRVMGLDSKYEVEREVKGEMGGMPIIGYIDRISWQNAMGEPIVIDLKSGKEPNTLLQLGTYALMLREELGIEVNKGAFYMAEKGELSQVHDLTQFSRQYIESLYEQAARGIAGGVFLPNPNAFCSTCTVKRYCGLYGNRPPMNSGVPMLETQITRD